VSFIFVYPLVIPANEYGTQTSCRRYQPIHG
jgi:hypothetical protein